MKIHFYCLKSAPFGVKQVRTTVMGLLQQQRVSQLLQNNIKFHVSFEALES